LLLDHREDLVVEGTRVINRLRLPLHELEPSWDSGTGQLIRFHHLKDVAERLETFNGIVTRIAFELVERVHEITTQQHAITREIAVLVTTVHPNLLAPPRVRPLAAGKIVDEVSGHSAL
jgi:hypothetical protein